MNVGITVKPTIGVGDAVQFSSVPENYFRHTGKMLIDLSNPWFFDHNPYVIKQDNAEKIIEMWNYGPKQYEFPKTRGGVYLSNAELHASVLEVTPKLIRPRLYKFEEFPFEKRELILLHTHGRSHGTMPDYVLDHVLKKYKPSGRLFHVGLPTDPDLGIEKIETKSLWDLAKVISTARMFIGMDSGPSWIAACYPDVISKKIRTKPGLDQLKDWVPLSNDNIHSHWDDRLFQIFNVSEDDVGFTQSYRKI